MAGVNHLPFAYGVNENIAEKNLTNWPAGAGYRADLADLNPLDRVSLRRRGFGGCLGSSQNKFAGYRNLAKVAGDCQDRYQRCYKPHSQGEHSSRQQLPIKISYRQGKFIRCVGQNHRHQCNNDAHYSGDARYAKAGDHKNFGKDQPDPHGQYCNFPPIGQADQESAADQDCETCNSQPARYAESG